MDQSRLPDRSDQSRKMEDPPESGRAGPLPSDRSAYNDLLVVFLFLCYNHPAPCEKEVIIMARFVSKGKLSKKAQKEINRQRRVTWEFSPVTKTVESKKLYNRKKNSCDRHEDEGTGVFHFLAFLTGCPVKGDMHHLWGDAFTGENSGIADCQGLIR